MCTLDSYMLLISQEVKLKLGSKQHKSLGRGPKPQESSNKWMREETNIEVVTSAQVPLVAIWGGIIARAL